MTTSFEKERFCSFPHRHGINDAMPTRRRPDEQLEANKGPAPRPPDYKREPFATYWGEKSKSRKTKIWKVARFRSRKVEKYTFWLFTFWLFEFLPDTFPAEHAQLQVQNLNRWESRGKKKSWKVKKSKGERKEEKSKSQKVYFLTFHFLNFCRMSIQPNMCSSFFQLRVCPGILNSYGSSSLHARFLPMTFERYI